MYEHIENGVVKKFPLRLNKKIYYVNGQMENGDLDMAVYQIISFNSESRAKLYEEGEEYGILSSNENEVSIYYNYNGEKGISYRTERSVLLDRRIKGQGNKNFERKSRNNGKRISKDDEIRRRRKIINENGNLLVVYHGAENDFNIFDHSKIGKSSGHSYGYGFYFIADKEIANSYGNSKEYYLDIKKLISDSKKIIENNIGKE